MGVSHLLEHMVFKGTRKRTAKQIALELEVLGGSLDAYTSREHTVYQARVLDEHLDIAADVKMSERDRLSSPESRSTSALRRTDSVARRTTAIISSTSNGFLK